MSAQNAALRAVESESSVATHEAALFAPGSILHAAENIKGGVGAYLRDLLIMQRDEHGPGVVTALVPASQRGMVESPEGVEVITFDDRAPRFLSACRLAWRTRQIVARNAPRIVHLHSTFAGAALRPLLRARGRGAAVIYCAHGWAFDRETSFPSRWAARVLEWALSRLCDAVICISQHELRLAQRIGIPPRKLRLITNGIPRERPRGSPRVTDIEWPEGKRRVLFVGRFDRQKGTDLLLEALAELEGSVFCYLIGDSVLGDTSCEVSLPNARATGWLAPPEIDAFYRSADVVVVPSRWEGFGLIAVEAMRAERAVIASNVGGLTEIVQHDATGILLPPNDKAALVKALRDTNDDRLAAMGRAGRQRFLRHFTLERAHRQITELYRAATHERRGMT